MFWDPMRKGEGIVLNESNRQAVSNWSENLWIIGKQGFSTGRHSWKIECVRGSNPGNFIGVVSL